MYACIHLLYDALIPLQISCGVSSVEATTAQATTVKVPSTVIENPKDGISKESPLPSTVSQAIVVPTAVEKPKTAERLESPPTPVLITGTGAHEGQVLFRYVIPNK